MALCPRYTTWSATVHHQCGRGRFYCAYTPEGQLFNALYVLIETVDQRIQNLNGHEINLFNAQHATIIQLAAQGLALPQHLAVYDNGLPYIQQQRQQNLQTRTQATFILQEGVEYMQQRRRVLTEPYAFPIEPFRLGHDFRSQLTDEVRELVTAFDNAARGAIPEELNVDVTEADAYDRARPTTEPNLLSGHQRPLNNVANPGMNVLISPLEPPTARTYAEMQALQTRRDEISRHDSKATGNRQSSKDVPPARRSARNADKRVSYAEPNEGSESMSLDSESDEFMSADPNTQQEASPTHAASTTQARGSSQQQSRGTRGQTQFTSRPAPINPRVNILRQTQQGYYQTGQRAPAPTREGNWRNYAFPAPMPAAGPPTGYHQPGAMAMPAQTAATQTAMRSGAVYPPMMVHPLVLAAQQRGPRRSAPRSPVSTMSTALQSAPVYTMPEMGTSYHPYYLGRGPPPYATASNTGPIPSASVMNQARANTEEGAVDEEKGEKQGKKQGEK